MGPVEYALGVEELTLSSVTSTTSIVASTAATTASVIANTVELAALLTTQTLLLTRLLGLPEVYRTPTIGYIMTLLREYESPVYSEIRLVFATPYAKAIFPARHSVTQNGVSTIVSFAIGNSDGLAMSGRNFITYSPFVHWEEIFIVATV